MPVTVWKGEGNKHLQGYYTKDGSVDGDWGERVESYPYFGAPTLTAWSISTPGGGTRFWRTAEIGTTLTSSPPRQGLWTLEPMKGFSFSSRPPRTGCICLTFPIGDISIRWSLSKGMVRLTAPLFHGGQGKGNAQRTDFTFTCPATTDLIWQNANGPSYHPLDD